MKYFALLASQLLLIIASLVLPLTSVANAEMKIIHLADFSPQNAYIDTVKFKMLAPKNKDFYRDDIRREITGLIPDKKSALSYRLWMQKKPATLVFIIPGLGSNDAGTVPTGLAELIYNAGCSVVIISNPFNWEFAKNASSKITPGYPPQDAQDIYRALIKITEDIKNTYGSDSITDTVLTGYSLGAINTLFVALLDSYENKINFSRFVALSPPVNLLYGMIKLDEMYAVWHSWPKDKLLSTKNRAVAFYETLRKGDVTQKKSLPFTAEEAQFAIGFVFRTSLGELIKAIHQRHDFGIIKAKQSVFSRETFEKEVEKFGYLKYVDTFVRAAYSNSLYGSPFDLRKLNESGSLPALQKMLSTHPNIRIIHTTNDFLLTNNDRIWLNNVMAEKIAFFDAGGHLGYFASPQALDYIVKTIKDENAPGVPDVISHTAHENVIPVATSIKKSTTDTIPTHTKKIVKKRKKISTRSPKSMPGIHHFPNTVDTVPPNKKPPMNEKTSDTQLAPFSLDTTKNTKENDPFPRRDDIILQPSSNPSHNE
jgi:hypothetical protein